MAFFDTTAVLEGATGFNGNFMDLAENAEIRTLEENTSLLEDAYLLISENEENWNNIMKACAYNELTHFKESGEEYIFTEASGTGFLASAKAFFSKIWEKIQALFKKFAVMLGSFVKNDKDFVEKNKGTISAALANIPKDAKFKGYKYAEGNFSKWNSTLSSAKNNAIGMLDDIKNVSVSDTHDKPGDDHDSQKIADGVRGMVCGKGGEVTASEFNKHMYEMFRGSENKEEIPFTRELVSSAMATLTNQATVKKAANDTYKELKGYFDKIDSALNEAAKKFSKAFGTEGSDAQNVSNGLVTVKRAIEANKTVASVFQAGNGIFLSCLKDYSRQCKAICVKTVMFKENTGTKHEGAGFTHYGEGADFLNGVLLK